MAERQRIHTQIRNLTHLLVMKSFVINQNYPKYSDNQIVWENFKNITFSHQNEPYEVIYEKCRVGKDYNFMLLDGALIQMQYNFCRNHIAGHILSFYPHPELERFQDYPEEYEELHYGNELFTDIVEKKIITFPLRFDFSSKHTDVIHPKIHATFGNYKDCRIPVSKPISPNRFVSFILRNFYYYKFENTNLNNEINFTLNFEEQISVNEKKLLHLAYE